MSYTESFDYYKEKYGIGYTTLSQNFHIKVGYNVIVFYKYNDGGDLFHRLDGPAFIFRSGGGDWWINGFDVTDEIIDWADENNIDLNNLTEVDKALIKIVWADYEES